MKYLLIPLLFLLTAKCFSQQHNYDSIQNELIRLFSNGNHKEAYRMADEILPILKNDPNRNDSIYSYILYYASIIYGLQGDYIKPAETTVELEKVVLQRFGSENMKYYGALYLRYEYYVRMGDQYAIIDCNEKIKNLLSKLLKGDGSGYSGFEMVYKKPDIKFCLSVSLNALAFAHGQIGKIAEADRYIKESEFLFDEEYLISHDPRSYTNFLFNYANFLNDIERLEEAENVYKQAVNWAKKVYNETHPSYAETLQEQASFYTTTGDYVKSIKILEQVKIILENSFQKNSNNYKRTIRSLANLYLNTNNFSDAISSINLLKKLKQKNENEDVYDNAANLIPQIRLMLIKNDFKAADSLLKIIESYEKINPTIYSYVIAGHANMRAAYHFQKKEYEKAGSYYTWLLKNELQNGKGKTNSYSIAAMRKANNFLKWGLTDSAEILILDGIANMTEVLKKNFSFFSDNQRQYYLDKTESLFYSLYNIASVIKSDELITASYNSQILLKGLLLKTSVLKNRQIKWKDSLQQQLFYEYVELRKAIVAKSGKPASAPGSLDKLNEEAEILEKKLSKLSGNLINQQFNSKTVQDIANSLKPTEAALEYISYNSSDTNYLGALLITYGKKQPIFISLCTQAKLDSLLKLKSINSSSTINLIYHGQISNSIYRLIWEPLENSLVNIKKIYFAPSGLLYQLSIAALEINKNELLSDKYLLSQVNTTGFIINQNNYSISANDKIILYGGITYDADSSAMKKAVTVYKNSGIVSRSLPDELERSGGFPYLPATQKEVSQIMNLSKAGKFSVQIRTGIKASEESIKALDGNASPAILHIASHGFFFPNPKKEKKEGFFENQRGSTLFKQSENPLFRAGLAFAGAELAWKGKSAIGIEDGILTAYEISNLFLPNTKLVVLSACETGLGDVKGTEGVYGLQRSFNMAGVQNLVMSLWKVPDTETAEFMTLLYKNIFAHQAIEAAFQNTQTIMKNKYRDEPYKWAAWILVR